jgi:glycosyltransferase involved in cell wall biosynthesis
MKISVIVTSYNRPELVRQALASLGSQSLLPDEVVIADDGSSADIAGILRDSAPGLRFGLKGVTHADLGFRLARSRNNGARVASGDLLVFTDQDIVFTKDYLRTIADNARKGEFLVSFPVRLSEADSLKVTGEVIKNCAFEEIVTGEYLKPVAKQYRKDLFYRLIHKIGLRPIGPKLRGGVCAIWKDDFVAVNGYDEMYRGWGNEDDDLGWRLYRYGVKGRNVTTVEVPIHLWHPTNSGGTRPNREYYKKRIAEIRKGDYRCEYGIMSPLGDDRPQVIYPGSSGELA